MNWTPEFTEIIAALGIEIASKDCCKGKALIDFIRISGTSKFVSEKGDTDFGAWISSMPASRLCSFRSDEFQGMRYFISNEEPGVQVIGNRTWGDTRMAVQFKIHSADRAGIYVDHGCAGFGRFTVKADIVTTR